jgi:tRNA(Ile)-lysidine synthetase-like protein
MKINLVPGKYVLAVSGGVDSVVLLHALAQARDKYELVVAHYDHGIRADSNQDRIFVQQLAEKYGLEFFFEVGRLGPKASEALARDRRYAFLSKIKSKTKSKAIVTAHHQDDVIETAIINVLRGTGRKGISSLKSTGEIKRPLLSFGKSGLINYAKENNLPWQEDKTNLDQKYLRNYVRHSIVGQLDAAQKQKLLEAIRSGAELNSRIDDMLARLAEEVFSDAEINRHKFIALPHDLSRELLAHWLREKNINFDKKTIDRLVIFIKTAKKGGKTDISKNNILIADKEFISLSRAQSV